MVRTTPRPWHLAARAATLSIVLLAAALAGCTGPDDRGEDNNGFQVPDSFDDAMALAGPTLEPDDANSTIRLKVLYPWDLDHIDAGASDVAILVYDDADESPVTDATVALDAYMTQMQHGTSPEEDPEHEASGVYVGMTTFSMGGDWELRFDVTLDDGTELYFATPVTVHMHA